MLRMHFYIFLGYWLEYRSSRACACARAPIHVANSKTCERQATDG